ncbi:MAG: hypoxanthine-guanine phosphoribosyltransferase [Pseudomonadota bacterium]
MQQLLDEVKNMQKNAKCLFAAEKIEAAIDKVAKEMTEKLADENPVLLCVMNGAVIFMGQLVTKLLFPLQIDYIHATRYRGEMLGKDLHWLATPSIPIEGRTVVIIEDILDTGLTLSAIIDYCQQAGAKRVLSAVLIDKDHPRDKGGVDKADFTGLHVEDKFIIGYGLDYQEYLRNLPGIYAVEQS